jgi:phosphopantetheine--protein transferase-like protein
MLGVDLVYIPEFKKQLRNGGDGFLKRVFNASELQKDTIEHLAGVWAAKEAVVKAGGLSLGRWTDIQITYEVNGRPTARVKKDSYDISIAHHGDYAVAVAQKVS